MSIDIKPNHKYLVTGGSGFLGGALISRILSLGGRVSTLSRNEGKLIELKEKYPDIEIHTGAAEDLASTLKASIGCTGVFHLAAYKHVGLAESNVRVCIGSNVMGSLRVLDVAVSQNMEFALGISTDKAAQVSGVYGATKHLMEKVFQEYEAIYPTTAFRLVRYGNVLYSTGSVLCKWKKLLQEGKGVVVTDSSATRFFWTLDQAVDLIFDALSNAKNSSPYVPVMKSMSIGNLLEAMALKYLPSDSSLKVKEIGLQVGENLHEKILENGPTSEECERYTVDEIKDLI